jgi:adenosylcobinamide-GDP ribazoletransferase
MFRRFLATLGFLSRLAPARVMDEADMARAMFHLPLCGLVIGALACAPALPWALAGRPQIAAWCVVALGAWITRGLHLDGLCDILDASAAHVEPERFWRIVKDSRCGAFGVIGVCLALLGQQAFLAEILRAGPAWRVVWIFVFGRACGVCLGFLGRAWRRPGLGGLFLAGADAKAVAWALCCALAPAALFGPVAGPLAAGVAACLAGGVLWALLRLGRAVAGVNGDFLGAAIVLGELCACAGLAAA